MCGNMDSVEILIRAVPCLVHFLSDASSKVVATAVSCLTRSLTYVTRVPRSQRKVFVEYIFPDLLDCLFTRTSKMTPEQLQVDALSSSHTVHRQSLSRNDTHIFYWLGENHYLSKSCFETIVSPAFQIMRLYKASITIYDIVND